MATAYEVAVQNKDGQPLQGVRVFPVDTSDGTEGAAVTTDLQGLASFSGLADADYRFRIRPNIPGAVIQVIDFPDFGTVSGLTSPRIVYVGSGPELADDDDLQWDATNRRIRIGVTGTGTPSAVIGSLVAGVSGEGFRVTYEYANDRTRIASEEVGVSYRGITVESSDFIITVATTGGPVIALAVDGTANVVVGNGSSALATDATDGFLYIPTCAGTPTGTPTSKTGSLPIVYDSTNNVLYVYDSGWKGVGVS